ncbi:MAG: hypothetical protein ABMA01_09235 [Chthoniobacteraceae bacterium]
MPSESDPTLKSLHWARLLIVFVIAFDIAAFWQWSSGAYRSEFGGHPDEGAHYVSGLVVRDLMAELQANRHSAPDAAGSDSSGTPGKQLLGEHRSTRSAFWPPGLSIAQSAWSAGFGTSRLSVLLLVAALAAAVATLLYGAVRMEFGEWAAIAAALLWLCAGLVRESYGMVMPEMLGALTMFGAVLAWDRFLKCGSSAAIGSFALLSSVALWTEGAGVSVLPMAGISLVWTRRWRLLARWDLWVMGALPLIALIYVRKIPFERFSFDGSSVINAAANYAPMLAFVAGLAVAGFAAAGVLIRCLPRDQRQGRWVAMASLVMSIFAYHCVSPGRMEARHVIAAAPALILLAIAGAASIASATSRCITDAMERRRRESLWILLLVLLALPFEILKPHRKEFDGFGAIARTLIAQAPRDARILISSDATGEGMFISELALGDCPTEMAVETAAMSLTTAEDPVASPQNPRERFSDDGELLKYLTSGRIQYVLLDDALPYRERAAYHDQIRRVLEENVRSFWPILESEITRGGEVLGRPAKLYRVIRDR